MGISEDANAAADYIETHGWFQGDFIGPNGSVCLLGALGQGSIGKANNFSILDESVPQTTYKSATSRAIVDYLGVIPGRMAHWNDRVAQSKEEVVQVLRDVATKHMPDSMTIGGEDG